MSSRNGEVKPASGKRALILAQLDIEAEYRAMGVRIVGRNSGGWVDCHAAGREDGSPSAAINAEDDRYERGQYRDRGTGESLSIFDFAMRYGGIPGVVDYPSALRHFAERAGVGLENGRSHPAAAGEEWRSSSLPAPLFPMSDERADPDTLHRVYSELIRRLPALHRPHMQALRLRGFADRDLITIARHDGSSTDTLAKRGYRSIFPPGCVGIASRAGICAELIQAGLEEAMSRTPGFIIPAGKEFWTLAASAGIAIPIRDAQQRIVAITVRQDDATQGGKYKLLSSRRRTKPSGASPGQQVHHSLPHKPGSTSRVALCEGPLKADVIAMRCGVPALGLPGHEPTANIKRQLRETFREWGVRNVVLCPDGDFKANPAVAKSLVDLVEFLRAEGLDA